MKSVPTIVDMLVDGVTIPPEHVTDTDMTVMVETLAAYARKHLPEGFVLSLNCSRHAHKIEVLLDGDQVMRFVEDVPNHWGKACDRAIEEDRKS